MAKRKIATIENNGRVAKIYRNAAHDEYEVRFAINGVDQQDADYFTNDKQDAIDTANAWATQETEQSPAELLKADTIAKFEKRIEELSAILKGPDAQKYMVVCGDEHPMPINFEATDPKWPWTDVEGATKWNSRQFAEANAVKVVNGKNQVGKAVRVDHYCEWDMQNLSKLINDLNAAK